MDHCGEPRFNCNQGTVCYDSDYVGINQHYRDIQRAIDLFGAKNGYRHGDFVRAEVTYDPMPFEVTNRSMFKSVQGPTSITIWRIGGNGPTILRLGEYVSRYDRLGDGEFLGELKAIRQNDNDGRIDCHVIDGKRSFAYHPSRLAKFYGELPDRMRLSHSMFGNGLNYSTGMSDSQFNQLLPVDSRTSAVEPSSRRGGVDYQTHLTDKRHNMNMTMDTHERERYNATMKGGIELDLSKFDIPSHIHRSDRLILDVSTIKLTTWMSKIATQFGLNGVMSKSVEIFKKMHTEPEKNSTARYEFVRLIEAQFSNYKGDPMDIFDACSRLWCSTIRSKTKGRIQTILINLGDQATAFDLFNVIRVEQQDALSKSRCRQFAREILNVQWRQTESVQDLHSKLTNLTDKLDAISDGLDGSSYLPQPELIVTQLLEQARKRTGFAHIIDAMTVNDEVPKTWQSLLGKLRPHDYRMSLSRSHTLNQLSLDANKVTDEGNDKVDDDDVTVEANNESNDDNQQLQLMDDGVFNQLNVKSSDDLDYLIDTIEEIKFYKMMKATSNGTCTICALKGHDAVDCAYNHKSKNFKFGRMHPRHPEERQRAFKAHKNSSQEAKAFYENWEKENPLKVLKSLQTDVDEDVNDQPAVKLGSMMMEPSTSLCSSERSLPGKQIFSRLQQMRCIKLDEALDESFDSSVNETSRNQDMKSNGKIDGDDHAYSPKSDLSPLSLPNDPSLSNDPLPHDSEASCQQKSKSLSTLESLTYVKM